MKIVETDAAIEREIIALLQERFIEVKAQVKLPIEDRIRDVVITAIKNEPEYYSLLSGRLLGEFGLTDPTSKLDAILAQLSKQILVSFDKNTLKVQAIHADLKDILALPEALQLTNKGVQLDWLDWLLVKGDRVIIREYIVEPALGRKSRTGLAIMVKEKRGKWKVPSQYSGTIRKNWITRALDNIPASKIENIIVEEIEKQW